MIWVKSFKSTIAILFCFNTLFLNIGYSRDIPVSIHEGIESLEVSSHTSAFIDDKSTLSIDDVARLEIARFASSNISYPSYGNISGTLWIRLQVDNPIDDDLTYILRLDSTVIESRLFYRETGSNNDFIRIDAGRIVSDEREGAVANRVPTYAMKFPALSSTTVFLSLRMDFIDKIRLSLLSERSLFRSERKVHFLGGFYVGAVLIMMFYNLFIYFSTRDSSYLYYVGCIFFVNILTINTLLMSGDFVLFKVGPWFEGFPVISKIIGTIFTAQFGRILLHTSQFPRFDQFLKLCIGSCFSALLVAPFMSMTALNRWSSIPTLLTVFSLIVFSGVLFSRGYRYARFFFIAWVPFISFIILHIGLNQLGYGHLASHSHYWLIAGSLFEIVLLSMALADKINVLEEEKKREEETHKNEIIALNSTLERKVKEQTRDIQAMMANVKFGVFAIEDGGILHPSYSAHLETILQQENLRAKPVKQILIDLLDISSGRKNQIETAIKYSLGETEFNFMGNDHILPKEGALNIDGAKKFVEVDWSPMIDANNEVDKILVSIRDVTAMKELRKKSEDQEIKIFVIDELLSSNYHRVGSFLQAAMLELRECKDHISHQINKEDLAFMFRKIHTIKGNARSFQFSILSDRTHKIEDYVDAVRQSQAEWDANFYLEEILNLEDLMIMYDNLLSKVNHSGVETRDDPVYLESVLLESLSSRLILADTLHKPVPSILLDVHSSRKVLPSYVETVLGFLGHILRNSMDHGIESPEDRISVSKNPEGRICLTVSDCKDTGDLVLQVEDDGKGLDLEKLLSKAVESGLIASDQILSDLEIASLIFSPSLSTSNEVSMISGRGVGMDAVKNHIEEVGGKILIILKEKTADSSSKFLRFSFQIRLPAALFYGNASSDKNDHNSQSVNYRKNAG